MSQRQPKRARLANASDMPSVPSSTQQAGDPEYNEDMKEEEEDEVMGYDSCTSEDWAENSCTSEDEDDEWVPGSDSAEHDVLEFREECSSDEASSESEEEEEEEEEDIKYDDSSDSDK
jgi:hypothetical protein